jgi:putative metalloprotease
MNGNMLASSGVAAFKAATLSDADVKALSNDACKQMDATNKVAGASSKYTKRLNTIAKALGNNADGTPVNYKVYLTSDVNAWAMANGCVRVYSGLMDLMTDNEVEAVLGHELGHVALGHSKKPCRQNTRRLPPVTQFLLPAALRPNCPAHSWGIWRMA